MNSFDVIISGYGPTGLVAASLLARRGHSVCVFERWPTLYGQPRVATIDGESARIIQAAADVDFALRHSTPRARYVIASERGEPLVDHDWDRDHVCGFPYRISVHQPDIEDALDAAARAAGVEVNAGWETTAVEQDDERVLVTARERAADGTLGRARSVGARFMIGADGARGATRELLGVRRESWPFRNAWLSVDATRRREVPNLFGVSPDGRIATIFCAPRGRAHSIIPLGADVIRFNFQIDPDVDRASVASREIAYRYLRETYELGPTDVDVFRQAVHAFEGKLAETWRVGRVFIAGDTAHAMTPFMGQGGCSAFRDAINLSWKLDLVLRGLAPDPLLDTYEAERKPHARHYVDGSDKLGAMVFIEDPEEAKRRDRVFLEGDAPPSPPDPTITNGLVQLGRDGKPIAPAGELAPQGRVEWRGETGRFDDVFGFGCQVLCRGGSPTEILRPDQIERLKTYGATIVGFSTVPMSGLVHDVDGVYTRFFDKHGLEGLIARPDFVIYAGARSSPDLTRIVDELIGRLSGMTPA